MYLGLWIVIPMFDIMIISTIYVSKDWRIRNIMRVQNLYIEPCVI